VIKGHGFGGYAATFGGGFHTTPLIEAALTAPRELL
jgi:hypothetical protein